MFKKKIIYLFVRSEENTSNNFIIANHNVIEVADFPNKDEKADLKHDKEQEKPEGYCKEILEVNLINFGFNLIREFW